MPSTPTRKLGRTSRSGIPANIPQFRAIIREFLRDRAPFNTLLDGQETSDLLIDVSIQLAIDDFNTTAPVISIHTVSNFPSFYLLLYGTLIQVLRSAGILQSRNQLDYSDGGVSVSVSNKTALYQSWIQMFSAEYETKKLNLKIFLNVQQGFGGVHSEYILTSFGGGNFFGFGSLDGDSLARLGVF